MEKVTWGVEDLAPVLKLGLGTIKRKTSAAPHSLPPSILIGRNHLWLPATVLEWLKGKEGFATAQRHESVDNINAERDRKLRRRPGRPPNQYRGAV